MGKFSGSIRMAKATTTDIEGAMDLCGIVDALDRGYYPVIGDQVDQDAPTFFDPHDAEHLLHLHTLLQSIADRRDVSLFRVVMGMDTILRNDILDPDVDHLAIHPKFAAENKRLRDALAALVGSGDVAELRGMELALRQLPAPDEDKAVTINAIHVLIATAPEAEVAHG